jgi:hypothetical protein
MFHVTTDAALSCRSDRLLCAESSAPQFLGLFVSVLYLVDPRLERLGLALRVGAAAAYVFITLLGANQSNAFTHPDPRVFESAPSHRVPAEPEPETR